LYYQRCFVVQRLVVSLNNELRKLWTLTNSRQHVCADQLNHVEGKSWSFPFTCLGGSEGWNGGLPSLLWHLTHLGRQSCQL